MTKGKIIILDFQSCIFCTFARIALTSEINFSPDGITQIVILLEVSQKVSDSVSVNFCNLCFISLPLRKEILGTKSHRIFILEVKGYQGKMEVEETSVVNALRILLRN